MYHSVYDSFYWYTHFSDGEFTHYGGAVARHRHRDPAPRRRGRPAVRVHRRRPATLRGYVDEIEKLADATTKARTLDSRSRSRKSIDAAARSRRGQLRGGAREVRGRALPPDATLAELNRAALHERTRVPLRGGTAAARVVQAPRLRARLLHRLRRQDAARHPRRDRAEAIGRSAQVRADRGISRRSPSRRRRESDVARRQGWTQVRTCPVASGSVAIS